jgi:hypothetical protein
MLKQPGALLQFTKFCCLSGDTWQNAIFGMAGHCTPQGSISALLSTT